MVDDKKQIKEWRDIEILAVIEGYWKWYHSKACIQFPIRIT